MLPVRIDAAAVGVAVLERPAVAGGDPRAQAAVLPERQHLGAARVGDRRGAVGRAVVDDEHVCVGQLVTQPVEHRRQVVLLVPRGDEDDGVAHTRLRLRASALTLRSCLRRTDIAASSQTNAEGDGATRTTESSVTIPASSYTREKK